MQAPKVSARASRSCGNCRAVKRRCDHQLPHCGQCLRLRENCPGYRDEWELVFRDQTDHTIKRSRAKRARSAAADTEPNVSPPSRSLSPSVDEIGVNYFFYSFVTTGGRYASRGCLDYIPSVHRVDGKHPTLLASMAAVGLVALANATQRPELAGCALTKYSEAINNINAALASPVESVKDSTLMSVISLGVFEHVSRQESWARHVLGAAAIMVARGKSQFSSPVAIRMFNQVRADLVTACLHWRGAKPFPEDMLELQGEANKHADMSNATWLVGVMGPRCAVLLTRVRKNNGGIPWTELLEEATVIERDLRHAVGILAIQEPYTTTRNSGWDPSIVYNGRLDYYRDFWAIRVWNNSRNLQMVLYEILCFLLNKVLATDLAPTAREHMELKLRETLQAQSKLGEDVLATVPQTLKFVSSTSGAQSSVYPSFYGSVSGGYMLTWCLYVVGTSVATKSEARKWIIRCLQDIGRNMGISMALELVEDVIKISQCAG